MGSKRNRNKGKVKKGLNYKPVCGCWECEDGKVKRRVILARDDEKELKRALGYSRVGHNNV